MAMAMAMAMAIAIAMAMAMVEVEIGRASGCLTNSRMSGAATSHKRPWQGLATPAQASPCPVSEEKGLRVED